MEQIQMNSDAVHDDIDHLAHYGVKGMHWGVWNAETRAKYSRAASRGLKASGQMAIKGAKAVYRKAKVRNAVSKERRTVRKQKASDRRAQRKELGMDPVKYNKLRRRTLKSHDPAVVARGMHTLTDEELGSKIRRLQQEDVVAKMASSRTQDAYRTRQARSQALAANPIYKLGEGYVKKIGDRALDTVLPKKGKKSKGNSGKKSKGNSGNNNKGHDSSGKASNDKKSKNGSKKIDYEKAKSYIDTLNEYHPQKRAVDNGVRYLTSGNGSGMRDDVIDLGKATIVDEKKK